VEQRRSREIAAEPSTKPSWPAADLTIGRRIQAKEGNRINQHKRPNAGLKSQAAWQDHRSWQRWNWKRRALDPGLAGP